MAIAFDAYTSMGSGTGTLSATHTPVGTPRAVIMFGVATSGSSDFSSATYGGVAMTRFTGAPVLVAGENGTVDGWFLGSSIPTGAQTAQVTVGAAGTKFAGVFTLTASSDTAVTTQDTSINSTSLANPSVTLSLGGISSWCALAFFSGQGDPTGITPLTNWTSRTEFDFGSDVGGIYSYDIVGTSDVTAGWTQTADDAGAVCVAIKETGGAASTVKQLSALGVG